MSFQANSFISKASRQDSGLYKCRAENGVEPAIETEFELQVSGTEFRQLLAHVLALFHP